MYDWLKKYSVIFSKHCREHQESKKKDESFKICNNNFCSLEQIIIAPRNSCNTLIKEKQNVCDFNIYRVIINKTRRSYWTFHSNSRRVIKSKHKKKLNNVGILFVYRSVYSFRFIPSFYEYTTNYYYGSIYRFFYWYRVRSNKYVCIWFIALLNYYHFYLLYRLISEIELNIHEKYLLYFLLKSWV